MLRPANLPPAPAYDRAEILARLHAVDPGLASTSRGIAAHAARAYITHDCGSDPSPTQRMLQSAQMLAFKDSNVLILGETGTGKELVAKILHAPRLTKQPPGAFIAINCSGIVDTLFESLLFGHSRGSFTGAITSEPGLLRAAQNGTAFLDEVGDLPLSQQAKLLRALTDRKVRPVGDTIEHPINCRFVFATHRNIRGMVAAGSFREDLYYRISTHVLRTVPLRDRPADALLIAQEFCREKRWEAPDSVPEQVYAAGNVRGLQNWLTRMGELALEPDEALIDL